MPVSGPMPQETGSLPFLSLGVFTLGTQPYAEWVQSLARELPHAMGAAKKKKKKRPWLRNLILEMVLENRLSG